MKNKFVSSGISSEQFIFQRSVLLIYVLNVVFASTVAVASMQIVGNSICDVIFIVLIMAGAPALGAYGIIFLTNWCNNPVLTVLLNCVQVFLLALVFYVHFYWLGNFDFIFYAKHAMFLAPSLLVPWVFYAVCGLVISFVTLGVFQTSKKIKSLIDRVFAKRKSEI